MMPAQQDARDLTIATALALGRDRALGHGRRPAGPASGRPGIIPAQQDARDLARGLAIASALAFHRDRARARPRGRRLASASALALASALASSLASALPSGGVSLALRAALSLAFLVTVPRALGLALALICSQVSASALALASGLAGVVALALGVASGLARLLARASALRPAVGQVEKPGHALGARTLQESRAKRVAPSAQPLLVAATWLLPPRKRARFAEEYSSELWDLAATGAGRRAQFAYAFRQLLCAMWLRAAVLAPRQKSASP